MKLPARCVLWLLPLVLAGCKHKANPNQNQALAPAIAKPAPPSPTPVELPPSATTIPTKPTQNAKEPTEPGPRHPVRRKKPPAPPATTQEANTQQASNVSPGVSAIGELSSGDPASLRQQTEDSIIATERSLNSINRSLSDAEQTTADHIREFLKQARAALGSGDVDGAHTLTAKAKVLLSELITP